MRRLYVCGSYQIGVWRRLGATKCFFFFNENRNPIILQFCSNSDLWGATKKSECNHPSSNSVLILICEGRIFKGWTNKGRASWGWQNWWGRRVWLKPTGHEAVISKAMFRFLSRAALWLQRNQKGEGARKLERHGPEGKPVREFEHPQSMNTLKMPNAKPYLQ